MLWCVSRKRPGLRHECLQRSRRITTSGHLTPILPRTAFGMARSPDAAIRGYGGPSRLMPCSIFRPVARHGRLISTHCRRQSAPISSRMCAALARTTTFRSDRPIRDGRTPYLRSALRLCSTTQGDPYSMRPCLTRFGKASRTFRRPRFWPSVSRRRARGPSYWTPPFRTPHDPTLRTTPQKLSHKAFLACQHFPSMARYSSAVTGSIYCSGASSSGSRDSRNHRVTCAETASHLPFCRAQQSV